MYQSKQGVGRRLLLLPPNYAEDGLCVIGTRSGWRYSELKQDRDKTTTRTTMLLRSPANLRLLADEGGRFADEGGTLPTYSIKYMVCPMAEQPRLDSPGVLHHVNCTRDSVERVFGDDKDRNDYIFGLSVLAETRNFMVYARTLMPSHFHLLVRAGNR